MKYKVGEKVKVRQDLVAFTKYGNDTFLEEMEPFKTVTVKKATRDGYLVKENVFQYTDEMLDGLVEENDVVNKPEHYTYGAYECIDIMRSLFGDEAVKAFCRCNIFKYTYRAEHKNGEEDRKKAEWYTEYLMNMEKEV